MNDVLSQPSEVVAPLLLGWQITRTINGKKLSGIIVETEAYDQKDAASHSFKGKTPRTEVMFGQSGHAYVYFTYGMHYCLNVVTRQAGYGSGVLIRALEPIEGVDFMKKLRNTVLLNNLTNGPAKLCQALQVNKEFNGHDLRKPPLQLIPKKSLPQNSIGMSTRIGISKDVHRLWRFYVKDNQYVSHPKH